MTFIMGLLILAFAMWGVQDYFTQSSNDAVAVVNGTWVSEWYFASCLYVSSDADIGANEYG